MSFKSVGCAVLQPRSSFNSAFQATETFNYLDGSKYYTWTAVRRQNIDKLVSSIIRITVFVTAAQAFGGQAPYLPYARGVTDPSQHGIAYQLGAVTWWLLSLVITPLVAILWFPLFKWITPANSSDSSDELSHAFTGSPMEGLMRFLRLLNGYVYTGLACCTMLEFAYHLYETVKHVDAHAVYLSSPSRAADVRRVRRARLGLASGMVVGVGLGAALMIFWRWLDLVHVTKQEYAMIIIPTQLTIGIALASAIQVAYEKKAGLSHDEELFEKDSKGELTLEGMRQALSYIANSKIDMRELRDIAVGKDEKKTEEKKSDNDGQKGNDQHTNSPPGNFNDEKVPLL